MTSNADFKRRVRERMARTGESYTAARAHLLPRRTLHVTNGDARSPPRRARDRRAAVARRAARGPGPAGPPRPARGRRWAPSRGVASARRGARGHRGDLVLWFEADLYDQLQIAEILVAAHGRDVALRQVGEHVGIAHFGGLGELTPEQLEAIPQIELSAEAIAYGARAYAALTAPTRGAADARTLVELRFMPRR